MTCYPLIRRMTKKIAVHNTVQYSSVKLLQCYGIMIWRLKVGWLARRYLEECLQLFMSLHFWFRVALSLWRIIKYFSKLHRFIYISFLHLHLLLSHSFSFASSSQLLNNNTSFLCCSLLSSTSCNGCMSLKMATIWAVFSRMRMVVAKNSPLPAFFSRESHDNAEK